MIGDMLEKAACLNILQSWHRSKAWLAWKNSQRQERGFFELCAHVNYVGSGAYSSRDQGVLKK